VRRHRAPAIALLLVVALALACRDGSTKPAPTVPPSTPDTPAPTATPAPTEDPGLIQPLIDALQTRDPEAVRLYIAYTPVACSATPAQDVGSPPACEAGEEDGHDVEVFFLGSCEGEYVRPAGIDRPLAIMANTVLYAVYRLPPGQTSGQYSAILIDQDEARLGYAWEAIIKDEQIVALLFSCSSSPQELVELRGYTEAVVPPQTP
jgi:hypothetical protein